MSGIIDFRTPAAGFDQPIEMWLACHERMMRMIALLARLREHVANDGASESAGVTANSILRYFNEAAPRHHEDEEVDLFPRLLTRLKGIERDSVRHVIDKLTAEHKQLERLWDELSSDLIGIEAATARRINRERVAEFVTVYQQHIDLENEVLAPVFRRTFSADDLEAIGSAMAARRGVRWSELRMAQDDLRSDRREVI